MRKTRYQRKRLHKRKMIRTFEIQWDRGRKSFKQIMMEEVDPHFPIRYWQRFYLSGRKRMAKLQTNIRLRQHYRVAVKKEAEDVEALHQGEYRRHFDYWWTVD